MGKGGAIIKEGLLQILFPPRCVVCDKLLEAEDIRSRRHVHPLCEKKLYPVGDTVCFYCGKPLQSTGGEYCFDCRKKITAHQPLACVQGKSIYRYQGEIRKSVYRFKYSNRREYAGFYAQKAVERYGDWILKCGIEAIVPIPMYSRKKRKRGYNQAEVFAKELSDRLGLALETRGVRRVRNTPPQKFLNDQERKNNLKKAFQATEFIVKYKCILLVDDIYTTGSTVEAVAEVIRQSGVEKVYFLTLCTGEGIAVSGIE